MGRLFEDHWSPNTSHDTLDISVIPLFIPIHGIIVYRYIHPSLAADRRSSHNPGPDSVLSALIIRV